MVYPICCKSRFMGLYTSMVYPRASAVQMQGILRMLFLSFFGYCCCQDVPEGGRCAGIERLGPGAGNPATSIFYQNPVSEGGVTTRVSLFGPSVEIHVPSLACRLNSAIQVPAEAASPWGPPHEEFRQQNRMIGVPAEAPRWW